MVTGTPPSVPSDSCALPPYSLAQSDPPTSQTEPEARAKYGDDQIKIYKSSFTSLYYSMMEADDKEPTAYKLICVGPEEKVVGLHLIGMGSDEMLQGFAVAIKMGGASRFRFSLGKEADGVG